MQGYSLKSREHCLVQRSRRGLPVCTKKTVKQQKFSFLSYTVSLSQLQRTLLQLLWETDLHSPLAEFCSIAVSTNDPRCNTKKPLLSTIHETIRALMFPLETNFEGFHDNWEWEHHYVWVGDQWLFKPEWFLVGKCDDFIVMRYTVCWVQNKVCVLLAWVQSCSCADPEAHPKSLSVFNLEIIRKSEE